MFTTATPKAPKAPRTFTDSPEYVAALAKLNELKHKLLAIDAEFEAARLSRIKGEGDPTGGIETQARALLAGGTAATETAVPLETIGAMTKTQRVLRSAIEIQSREVADVRARINREIVVAARDEYRSILRDIAEVLAPICALAAKEAAFRDRLSDEGISLALLYPCPLKEMRTDVYGSKVNRWLDEVELDHGIKSKINRRRTP